MCLFQTPWEVYNQNQNNGGMYTCILTFVPS